MESISINLIVKQNFDPKYLATQKENNLLYDFHSVYCNIVIYSNQEIPEKNYC